MRHLLVLLALAASALAQTPRPSADPETFPLWETGAPGALGTEDSDRPALTLYRPNGRPIGTAVIVAPGGGYGALAMNHEGRQVANWAFGHFLRPLE